MTEQIVNFSTVGVGQIPSGYEGFLWAAYQPNETFSGSVYVTNNTNGVDYSIQSIGFQMVTFSGQLFTVNAISASPLLGMGLDFRVKGYKAGELVYEKLIRPDNSSENLFPVCSGLIDTVQITSNALEVFEVNYLIVTF